MKIISTKLILQKNAKGTSLSEKKMSFLMTSEKTYERKDLTVKGKCTIKPIYPSLKKLV